MDKVIESLNRLIIENAGLEHKEINNLNNKRLMEDLGYDSIDIVQLMCDIEDEFGIKFEDLDELMIALENYDTLIDLVIREVSKDK